jgi:tetratricopeptide (TPR) repeat protein
MLKRIIIFFALLIPLTSSFGQKNLLEDSITKVHIYEGLRATYNFEFEKAEKEINLISTKYPVHPVSSFMKAMVVYWKYYPLTPNNEHSQEFISLMELCLDQSAARLDINSEDTEGIFFDLFGRAFYVMYWADNGYPRKVLPYLGTLYRHTMEGFTLKEKLNDFYFTTGLYNYYIEAYPEKHPSYKIITRLFQEGNKELGLKQLTYCANNSIFLRVEARYFLFLLYLNYENNLSKALLNLENLHIEFPDNSLYLGEYIKILLIESRYTEAKGLLDELKNSSSDFAIMLYQLYYAYYQEKYLKNFKDAYTSYNMALEMSEKYEDFTDNYNAFAWMGLGRYYAYKGLDSKANKYFSKARDVTSYEYVINDR